MLAHTAGEAPAGQRRAAAHRQLAQMTRGRGAGGHDFLGVFVAQFIELESAALRDLERLRQQGRGIKLAQALQGPQTALAVRKHGIPRGLQRLPQANRRQYILKGAAAPAVHVHIARGHSGQFQRFAQRFEQLQTARVETAGQELHAYPQTSHEPFAQPSSVFLLPL
jgi:hypothetical protein